MRPKPSDARLRKEDLFEALGYRPHPAQLEIHRSRARRRVLACGSRFGKSTVGVHEAVAELLTPRDTARGWLVAPTYDLTSKIFKQVVAIMHAQFAHRVISFDVREHRILIANLGGGRTEMRAMSADRPAGLLGESLDFLIVDEAAKLREGVWDQALGPRTLDRKGTVLLLSTPAGGGWFHQQFRRGQKGKDPDYQSWSMPTWLNPHVPADAIEAERARLPPDVFREQYGGEFVNVPPEVCDTCHGPKENARHFLVVWDGKEPDRCPNCNELVNEDGETAVSIDHTGERMTTIIIHGEDSPDPSTVPPIPDLDDLPDYARAIVLHPPTENPQELPDGIH